MADTLIAECPFLNVPANNPHWSVRWFSFSKSAALAALARVQHDRPLDRSWVNALRGDMDYGLWDPENPSQTPLMFDATGNRLNGKHRLTAFVESKLDAIVFPVIVGLPSDAYRSIDQGIKTRMHSAAHENRSNVTRDEARIGWLETIVSGDPKTKITTRTFAYLAEGRWRKQLIWAGEVIPMGREQGKAPFASALMYAHRADPDFTDPVGRAWEKGLGTIPAQLVRLRDDAMKSKHVAGDRSSRLAYTLKMLTVLAHMHQKKKMPTRINENLDGLAHFSALIRDGAAARWAKNATILGK